MLTPTFALSPVVEGATALMFPTASIVYEGVADDVKVG